LGKELFLVFNYKDCVRVHFLMDGFVRYNNAGASPDENSTTTNMDTAKQVARLEIQFTRDLVGFYQCSTDLRESKFCLDKWENMISLDICWSAFDSVRAFNTILEERNKNRMVSDVVMDQDILPGVGNIIKNEACFEAGVNPLSKICELSSDLVRHLIKMLRDFTAIFYDCRKTGKPLSRYYKMYRFSVCKECQSKVTKCHPGEYERGTYFCPKCQDNKALQRVRSTKNSLLGWARSGGTNLNLAPSPWSCAVCTLENKPGSSICAACGTNKNKRKSQDPPSQTDKKLKPLDSNVPPSSTSSYSTFRFPNNGTENKDIKPTELCKGHKKPCVKKTVSKEGPNKLRIFFTCPLSKDKSCNHFAWADLDHPKCKCGIITILREVYKLNQNNGREFFICPKSKKEQCDFFQWKDAKK
jgi:endonuclease VIII-like 3